jgi:flagellar biosynthesis/type III secretory pathway protein FliH
MNQELQALEASAVKLAVEIGEKIVGHAVEINPEYITNIVRQALGKAGGAAIKTVRVSPQDLEFIQVVGVAKQLKEFDGTWAFEADDTIRAGCVVSTSAGEVDFQIDKAWERMRDAVLKSKI